MSKEQKLIPITAIIVITVTFWLKRKEIKKGKIQPEGIAIVKDKYYHGEYLFAGE